MKQQLFVKCLLPHLHNSLTAGVVDELNSGRLESEFDRTYGIRGHDPPPPFKIDDCREPQPRCGSQVSLRPIQKGAGGFRLRWRHFYQQLLLTPGAGVVSIIIVDSASTRNTEPAHDRQRS